jgi:hypothetical protein
MWRRTLSERERRRSPSRRLSSNLLGFRFLVFRVQHPGPSSNLVHAARGSSRGDPASGSSSRGNYSNKGHLSRLSRLLCLLKKSKKKKKTSPDAPSRRTFGRMQSACSLSLVCMVVCLMALSVWPVRYVCLLGTHSDRILDHGQRVL